MICKNYQHKHVKIWSARSAKVQRWSIAIRKWWRIINNKPTIIIAMYTTTHKPHVGEVEEVENTTRPDVEGEQSSPQNLDMPYLSWSFVYNSWASRKGMSWNITTLLKASKSTLEAWASSKDNLRGSFGGEKPISTIRNNFGSITLKRLILEVAVLLVRVAVLLLASGTKKYFRTYLRRTWDEFFGPERYYRCRSRGSTALER